MVHVGPDRAQAVAAARQIGIIRGMLLCLLIVTLAPAIANLLKAKGHLDSIRWLSAVPLVAGFKNWRTMQVQSEYKYRPEAVSLSVSAACALIAVFPAAAWFHDERAMLASLFIEVGLYVVVSHLVLPRERVPMVDPAVRRAALSFGLPLMQTGLGSLFCRKPIGSWYPTYSGWRCLPAIL